MLFQSSVPNTYASTKASLAVGWGKLRTKPQQPWIAGETATCECGNPRLARKSACDRCAELDGLGDKGNAYVERDLIRALEALDGRANANELADYIGCTTLAARRAALKFCLLGKIFRKQLTSTRWVFLLPV
jgi:hypothetical protein